MKRILYFSIIALSFLGAFSVILSSCKKESVNTVNNQVHDTICVEKTVTEILVGANNWKLDELMVFDGTENGHFIRGGINTTGISYENIRLKFLADGTGTYIDEVGTSHTLSWSFITTDKRNVSLTIGPPSAQTFIWNMFDAKGDYLYSTSAVGNSLLLTTRYIKE